jgi:hypothetical protein
VPSRCLLENRNSPCADFSCFVSLGVSIASSAILCKCEDVSVWIVYECNSALSFHGKPLYTRPTDSKTGAGHQQPEFSFMTVVRIAVPDLAVGKKFYKARLGFEVETVKSGLRMHLSSESHPWIEIDRAKANHQLASLRLGGWLYVRVTASCYPRLSG